MERDGNADVRGPLPRHAAAGQVICSLTLRAQQLQPAVTDLPPHPPRWCLGIHKTQDSVKNQGKRTLPVRPPFKCAERVDECFSLKVRGKDS